MTTPRVDGLDAVVTPQRRQWLRKEVDALQTAFQEELPLYVIPAKGIDRDAAEFSPAHKAIGRYVEGQRLPLSQLSQGLSSSLGGQSKPDDLKCIICDIAARKYYGPKEGKEEVDLAPFEDVSRGPFWFWELRSLSYLPEGMRSRASAYRQKHKQMQDRMVALSAVLRLSEPDVVTRTKWTAAKQTRITKAIEKLERVADLQRIREMFDELPEEDLSFVRGGKRVKRDEVDEQELSAKKEMRREEKMASASGFGSVRSFRNAQQILKRCFLTPQKGTSPEAEVVKERCLVVRGRTILSCPEDKRLRFSMGDVAAIDAQMREQIPADVLQEDFLQTCQRVRTRSHRHSVIHGAPPTWARQPNYELNLDAECEKLFGPDWQSLEICPVRMKYLWFSSDTDCPAYYGPFPHVPGVNPRNPFHKLPSLDYEELFDEGWEEEPEGESLSAEDEEEDEKYQLSDEDDAFVVSDGYLSEDEGIGAEMEMDDTCSNCSSVEEGVAALATREGEEAAQLETRIQAALKTGKTLVLASVPVTMAPKRDWLMGDPLLLRAVEAVPMSSDKIALKKKI